MYNRLTSHYYVDVYKHAIFDEWIKWKTEKFSDIKEAVAYAEHETKHGNYTKVYEVSEVVGWQ